MTEAEEEKIRDVAHLFQTYISESLKYMESKPNTSLMVVLSAILTTYRAILNAAVEKYGVQIVKEIEESTHIVPADDVAVALQDETQLKEYVDKQFPPEEKQK